MDRKNPVRRDCRGGSRGREKTGHTAFAIAVMLGMIAVAKAEKGWIF
jgi:hypothetical protein